MWIGIANNEIIQGTNTGCGTGGTPYPSEGMVWESNVFSCVFEDPLLPLTTYSANTYSIISDPEGVETVFVFEGTDTVKLTSNSEIILPPSVWSNIESGSELDFSDNGSVIPSNYTDKPAWVDFPCIITATYNGPISNNEVVMLTDELHVTVRIIGNFTTRAMELILQLQEQFFHPVTALPCTNEEYLQYLLEHNELKLC